MQTFGPGLPPGAVNNRPEHTKVYLGYLPDTVSADVIQEVVAAYAPLEVYMLPQGADGYAAGLVTFQDYVTAAACVEAINKDYLFAMYNTTACTVIAKLHSSDKVAGSVKLFVGSLLPGTGEIHLLGVFNKYGRVIDVKTFQDKRRDNLISGYVVFETADAAAAACALNNTFVEGICESGRPIVVKVASKEKTATTHSAPFPALIPVSGFHTTPTHSGGMKLFVGNIPPTTTQADLMPHFCQYGNVTSLSILTKKVNADGMICAFVVYDSPTNATEAAAALHGATLPGLPRELVVKVAQNQEDGRKISGAIGAVGGGVGAGHISGVKLFVGCVPPDATEMDVRQHFGMYPGIVNVLLLNHKLNRSGDASALIIYDSYESANQAIAGCNGTQLPTRPYSKGLLVKLADKQDSNNTAPSTTQQGAAQIPTIAAYQTGSTPTRPSGVSSTNFLFQAPHYGVTLPTTTAMFPNSTTTATPTTTYYTPTAVPTLTPQQQQQHLLALQQWGMATAGSTGQQLAAQQQYLATPTMLPYSSIAQPTATPTAAGGTIVKVLNLPLGFTKNDVEELFGTYGEIHKITLHTSSANCSSEMTFASPQAASEAASELNDLQIGSYRLKAKVKLSTNPY